MHQARHLPLALSSGMVRDLLADLLHRFQRCLQAQPFSQHKQTRHVLVRHIFTGMHVKRCGTGKGTCLTCASAGPICSETHREIQAAVKHAKLNSAKIPVGMA